MQIQMMKFKFFIFLLIIKMANFIAFMALDQALTFIAMAIMYHPTLNLELTYYFVKRIHLFINLPIPFRYFILFDDNTLFYYLYVFYLYYVHLYLKEKNASNIFHNTHNKILALFFILDFIYLYFFKK